MTIVFNSDNSKITGERGCKEIGFPIPHETKGTHHFTVVDCDEQYKYLLNHEIAVPISSAKFFILD